MSFQVPKLTQSCCGCTLRIGCFIVGYVHLVALLVGVVITVASIIIKIINGQLIVELEFLESNWLEVGLFAPLVFTITYLFGCHTGTPNYMLSFIMYQVLVTITSMLRIMMFVMMHVMGVHTTDIFAEITFLVLQIYYSIVVYNYYQNLREGQPI